MSYAGILPVVGVKCPTAAWGADEHGSTSAFWSLFLCFFVLCGVSGRQQ